MLFFVLQTYVVSHSLKLWSHQQSGSQHHTVVESFKSQCHQQTAPLPQIFLLFFTSQIEIFRWDYTYWWIKLLLLNGSLGYHSQSFKILLLSLVTTSWVLKIFLFLFSCFNLSHICSSVNQSDAPTATRCPEDSHAPARPETGSNTKDRNGLRYNVRSSVRYTWLFKG